MGNSTAKKDMKNLDFSGETDTNGIDNQSDININDEEVLSSQLCYQGIC